jgi:hypothetical protein
MVDRQRKEFVEIKIEKKVQLFCFSVCSKSGQQLTKYKRVLFPRHHFCFFISKSRRVSSSLLANTDVIAIFDFLL